MSCMDELDWKVISVLEKTKNISKAADELFISQPAISRRIQNIERRFQTDILVRTKKGVHFTPAGVFLCQCAETVLHQQQEWQQKVLDMKEEPAGLLRIGASGSFTKYILPGLLRDFKQLYPNVQFSVTTGWSQQIMKMVNGGDIYFGFIRGDYEFSGRREKLFREKMYVVNRTPFSITDLPAMPQIDYKSDAYVQSLVDKWWGERFFVRPEISMSVDKVDTAKEMVDKGLGYAFFPELVVDQEKIGLEKQMLTYRSGDILYRNTWMVYQPMVTDLKLCRMFYEFVKGIPFQLGYND